MMKLKEKYVLPLTLLVGLVVAGGCESKKTTKTNCEKGIDNISTEIENTIRAIEHLDTFFPFNTNCNTVFKHFLKANEALAMNEDNLEDCKYDNAEILLKKGIMITQKIIEIRCPTDDKTETLSQEATPSTASPTKNLKNNYDAGTE